jgi:hypothetical protein
MNETPSHGAREGSRILCYNLIDKSITIEGGGPKLCDVVKVRVPGETRALSLHR